jgi:hypothetical protein
MMHIKFLYMRRTLLLIAVCCNLLFVSTFSVAQQNNIILKGQILDESTNDPLIGVSVLLGTKPPKSLANTDNNGRFSVTVPAGSQLIIRYIGYT